MIVHLTEDQPEKVDLLILGAGWTSTFLIPLLRRQGITYAATTTTGHDNTIPFRFDPDSPDPRPYAALPNADTVLITFPLKGAGQSGHLVKLYLETRKQSQSPSLSQSQPESESETGAQNTKFRFIQLGVTSVWSGAGWQDTNSPYDATGPRAVAEDELLALPQIDAAAVLALSGLYGDQRQPRNWVDRVIKSKEDLRNKGALHVIHGDDVSRAIVALHRTGKEGGKKGWGKRWLMTDMHVYDWWDLVQDWAVRDVTDAELPSEEKKSESLSSEKVEIQRVRLQWVGEVMVEEGIKALPRDASAVGRALDGRDFWREMGLWPSRGRIR